MIWCGSAVAIINGVAHKEHWPPAAFNIFFLRVFGNLCSAGLLIFFLIMSKTGTRSAVPETVSAIKPVFILAFFSLTLYACVCVFHDFLLFLRAGSTCPVIFF